MDRSCPSSESSRNFTPQHGDLSDSPPHYDDTEDLSGSESMAPPSKSQNAMGTLHFEASILEPRRIKIRKHMGNFPDQLPFTHFGTSRPQPESTSESEAYRSIPELSRSTIWVSTDKEFLTEVQKEWTSLREYSLNEGEHEAKAYELLLRAERRRPGFLPKIRQFVTERMIKFNIKPQDGLLWDAPPVLQESTSDYGPEFSFDITPDCTYWLSLQSFSKDYQDEIKSFVYVNNFRILTPYLFIEHKQNGVEYRKARHQIAAGASMAVYNRFTLIKDRIERTKSRFNKRDKSLLKVYGLHMVGTEYGFWIIEAQLTHEDEWNGATMTRICSGRLVNITGSGRYANYINEIHRWGLTVHAPSVREDLAICMQLAEPLHIARKRKRKADSDEESTMEEDSDGNSARELAEPLHAARKRAREADSDEDSAREEDSNEESTRDSSALIDLDDFADELAM